MRPVQQLGAVIAEFLADAETGAIRSASARPYTLAELRELRGALIHISAELGELDVAAVQSRDVRGLVDQLRAAGLPERRLGSILDALRRVYAYAVRRGLVTSSPLVGLTSPVDEAPSPTTAVLEFGERIARWTARAMVMAFAVAAVGVAVALV